MKDKNGTEISVGDSVVYKKRICTVREIVRERKNEEARVDDGIPENPNLKTNFFRIAAIVGSKNIEKTSVSHFLLGKKVIDRSCFAELVLTLSEVSDEVLRAKIDAILVRLQD